MIDGSRLDLVPSSRSPRPSPLRFTIQFPSVPAAAGQFAPRKQRRRFYVNIVPIRSNLGALSLTRPRWLRYRGDANFPISSNELANFDGYPLMQNSSIPVRGPVSLVENRNLSLSVFGIGRRMQTVLLLCPIRPRIRFVPASSLLLREGLKD